MNRFHKIKLATEILNDIERFDYCTAIALINRDTIPESYQHIEDLVVANYRLSIYDMKMIGKPTYFVSIRHLGFFQVM